MNNPKCPYCQTPADEHPVMECGNAWMATLLGWEEVSNDYLHHRIVTPDGWFQWEKIPCFTTSLDAQAQYVWPHIGLNLLKQMFWADIEYGVSTIKEDKNSIALASWRACVQYLEARKSEL